MKAIRSHLTPNAGTLIIVGLLMLVQVAGARTGAAPTEPLAPSQTLISYQGTLTDQDGNPLDGTVTMEFALYDAATEGSLLWGPETQSVEVNDGLFHVLLGSLTPINPADLAGDIYLEVTVDGETLVPREILASVAFAVEARGVSAPLDVEGWITSRGSSGGVLSAQNPNNQAAAVQLSWHDDVARIRIGGSGTGVKNGLDIQAVGNRSLLRVHDNGDIDITGSVSCGALVESNLQTEEELTAKRIDRFDQGDVLCWSNDQLERCRQAGDPLVQAVADGDGRPIVMGAELVKVVGPVKKGAFLIASDVPGYAMAADEPAFGTVIAQALEDWQGSKGIIKAMIRKF